MVSPALPETCCEDEQAAVWLWSGHAVYRGPSLRLDAHSGSVHCFALGLDAPFLLRSGSAERQVRSALIPARTRHQVVAGAGRMVFFYADPSAARLRMMQDQMLDHTSAVSVDHRDESRLITAWEDRAAEGIEALRRRFLGVLDEDSIDERIRTAMEIVRARPDEQVGAAEVAAAVQLSTSRFLHLFSEHAGTSFRRYRLWAKMCRTAGALGEGANLSTAAVAGGFASSSHFSDAFRDMFGLTATELLAGPTRLVVAGLPAQPVATSA